MLIYMDKKRYMITDCAVSLCKKLGKGGVSGFVNAFLRRFDLEEVNKALPQGDEGEAIACAYPLHAYKLLKAEYGERAKAIATAESKGVSVRFERGEDEYLHRAHIDTPFSEKYAHYIFENFTRDDAFDNGAYTFQSVGSIAICDCVEGCERLLDACSAPGGKSVLLSKKCKVVTAFELHEHRTQLIAQYKYRMGVENIQEFCKDSTVFDPAYKEQFDGVLCDVPCSGFGTVSENPDVKLFKKEGDVASLNCTQLQILNTCSQYVKHGGALYYSTCSIFQAENDVIVEQFLKEHSEFTVQTLSSPLVHEKKKYGLQFLPDTAYGAGFFVCKMIRK